MAVRARGPMIGRRPEREHVDRLFDQVHGGTSRVLVVAGESGIGKSALLAEATAVADRRDFTVLGAVGREVEVDVGYATLHALLRPVAAQLGRLEPVHAGWLRGALGLDVPADPPPGELGVYHALLELVTSLARDRPVAVIVDDAHWVDRASLLALSFVAHRLDADPVLMLFASRPAAVSPVLRAGFDELVLDGLTADDAVALLDAEGVAAGPARRCRELVGGNPLAMLEGARALDADQRAGTAPMPELLPVGPGLADEFERRLAGLPPLSAQAIALAALDPTGELAVVLAAHERLGGTAADLGPAEAAGIVVVDDDAVTWGHPLLRAVARDRTPGSERRRLRAALVDVAAGRMAPDVLAEHLAAIAEGPDEELARRLEDSGRHLVRRAALDAAATAYEHAARLSPEPGERTRRVLLAADTRVSAGRARDSLTLLEPLLAENDDPVLIARLATVVGSVETWMVNPTAGIHRLTAAQAPVRLGHPWLAARIGLQIAMGRVMALDGPAAMAAADDAVRLAAVAGDRDILFGAHTVRRVIGELTGLGELGGPAITQIAEFVVAAHDAGQAGTEMTALVCASAEIVNDELDAAEAHAEQIMLVSERAGRAAWAVRGRLVRSEVAWRQGRWSEALAELHQTISLDQALGGDGVAPSAWAGVARIEAALGAFDAAREHAERALDEAPATQCRWDIAPAWAARGLTALAADDLDDAVVSYGHVARATEDIRQPGLLCWHADAVEALHLAAEGTAARGLLERLDEEAAATAGRWARAAAARCRALLAPADDERDEEYLRVALDGFTAINSPFEHGRTLLVRGERRLARGRRIDGARDLAAARSIFDRLGSRPWSDRASHSRGEAPTGAGSLATLLTPAELRVALAVATGATNREAAGQLYLSAKTVDYHLRAIFRKLGLRSRAELAALVATERAASH